jgi:hypothetical protein
MTNRIKKGQDCGFPDYNLRGQAPAAMTMKTTVVIAEISENFNSRIRCELKF